jgi:hypothetical protein
MGVQRYSGRCHVALVKQNGRAKAGSGDGRSGCFKYGFVGLGFELYGVYGKATQGVRRLDLAVNYSCAAPGLSGRFPHWAQVEQFKRRIST